MDKMTTDLWVFFLLAFTLHNVEEALWLPKWSKQAKRFYKPVAADVFHVAVILVTLLAYLITFLAVAFPTFWLWKYIFHGLLGAMILNTIVPHLALTIILRTYSPGLITGLFLLIPINSTLLYRSASLGHVELPELILSILAVSVLLLTLLPLFFKIGEILASQMEVDGTDHL